MRVRHDWAGDDGPGDDGLGDHGLGEDSGTDCGLSGTDSRAGRADADEDTGLAAAGASDVGGAGAGGDDAGGTDGVSNLTLGFDAALPRWLRLAASGTAPNGCGAAPQPHRATP